MNDVRYAFRQMRRAPGFSLAVVLTLAVGIGGTAAMFTVVDGVLLAPLPYADDQSRVVFLREGNERGPASVALPNFFDWQARTRGLTAMGLFLRHDLTLTGSGEALPIDGALATSGIFAALGISPILGRGLAPDEDRPGAAPVAVVREDLWRKAFDGDPHIVGRTVRLDGVTHTIVGIMPERFRFPRDTTQVWVAFGHTLEHPETVLPAYALLNRIRLTSSDAVLAAAEQTIRNIAEQYFAPNMTTEDMRDLARSGREDLITPYFWKGAKWLRGLEFRADPNTAQSAS